MIVKAVQDGLATASDAVEDRCREIGAPTIRCGADGSPCAENLAFEGSHVEAMLRSAFIGGVLQQVIGAWDDETAPDRVELFDGIWAIPLAPAQRRRRSSFLIAFCFETRAIDSEEIDAACQSAALDVQVVRSELRRIAVDGASTVERLAKMLHWIQQDQTELAAGEAALSGFSAQLTESYEEISLLYKLGQSLNEVAHPSKFVRMLCDELHGTTAFGWTAAWFGRESTDPGRLAGRVFTAGEAPMESAKIGGTIASFLTDLEADKTAIVPARDGELRRLAGESGFVLAHPVTRDGRLLGALLAGDKQGPDRQVSSSDTKLLDAAGANLRILLENASLYDEQQAMFLGTLEALTAAIDAKDRYTCGHSERVAHLAMRLAAAVGLEDEEVERVRISGLVHDVGKIGVPEAVLCKTGRLTDAEFALIKDHPAIGHHILKDIPQLQDVLPAVLHHHERWDGRGYPASLAGANIPLYARIVGLADAFDAMSSTRTYREALPRQEVLDEVEKCAGVQFDPALAPVFLTLDFTEYDRLVDRHLEVERRKPRIGDWTQ